MRSAINHLKTLDKLQNSVPNFVADHIDKLKICAESGREYLSNLNVINKTDMAVKSYECLKFEENWMGKNIIIEDSFIESDIKIKHDSADETDNSSQSSESVFSLSDNELFYGENHSTPTKQDKLNNFSKFYNKKYEKKQNKNFKNHSASKIELEKSTLKKKNTRVPKYTVPFPSLSIMHNQQLSRNNLAQKFIANAKGLAPYSFHKSVFTIDNTSLFDSIAELIGFAYRNIKDFQKFCKSVDCKNKYCFLKVIIHWCNKPDHKILYSKRAEILFRNADVEGTRICIKDKLGTFFNKIFENHSALEKTCICEKCNTKQCEEIKILQISHENVSGKLQNEIDKYLLSNKNSKCQNCSSSLNVTYNCPPYFFIDLEDSKLNIYLNVLPKYLILNGKKYMLSGVVGYKDGADRTYTAYTRTVSGNWKEINPLLRTKIKLLLTIPSINIGMVLYIKIS